MKLTTYKATMIAEEVIETKSMVTYMRAWALLIKTGLCWKLQGWFGRKAAEFIDAGWISKNGRISWINVNRSIEND